jgi:PTH1 family peptidyl-tRNA hydrolase
VPQEVLLLLQVSNFRSRIFHFNNIVKRRLSQIFSVLSALSFFKKKGFDIMKYLIVGLGNIGPEYRDTRHNIGFMTVDALARKHGATFTSGRYGSTASVSVKGREMILLKPSTFMNLSGTAVRYWMQQEKIALENVLIVVDDLALPFGSLRLKGQGSDAGHNGLKHIAATLGTQAYARLRFGIGNDFPRGHQIDYVLGEFSSEEKAALEERLELAGEIATSFCLAGIAITMNQYNKR